MQKILIFLLCVYFLPGLAQEEITTVIYKDDAPISDGFSIVSEENKEFALFLRTGNSYKAKIFDSLYTNKKSLESDRIRNRELFIKGVNFNNKYHLIFKEDINGETSALSFDFKNDTITKSDLSLNFEKEELFGSFEHNGLLYFLSVGEEKESLHINTLNKDLTSSKISVNMSSIDILDDKDKRQNFRRIIKENINTIGGVGLDSAASSFPLTLPESTNLIKIYKEKNTIIFGFDISNSVSQLLTVNLSTGESSIRTFDKKPENNKAKIYQSNSFLKDDHLFQIKRIKNSIIITVFNVLDNTVLNSFDVINENQFVNINTATLKLKPSKRYRKEITTKEFLKSSYKDPLGIYTIKNAEETQIVYGTWNEKRGTNKKLNNENSGGNVLFVTSMAVGFGAVGGLTAGLIVGSSGNSVQSYGLHHLGTTTRAIGVFDSNFEHISDKGVQANIYHKIDYFNAKREDTTPLFLFQFNDDIIYGSFFPLQNAVKLLKF